jgi:hypothetical protein
VTLGAVPSFRLGVPVTDSDKLAQHSKPELPRSLQLQLWVGLALFAALAVTMTWLGLYSVNQQTTGTRYNATVTACHGGRYNPCDIVVHTTTGDVRASANLLDNTGDGETVRVIADGAPPWRHVTQIDNPLAWPIIVGIFITAGIGLAGLVFIMIRVQRAFGLASMLTRHDPPLPEWHPY